MLKVQRSETHKVKAPAGMVAEDWARFVELPYFVNKWRHLGLNDNDLRALQVLLTVQPKLAPVMEGTGGLGSCGLREREKAAERAVRSGLAMFILKSLVLLPWSPYTPRMIRPISRELSETRSRS